MSPRRGGQVDSQQGPISLRTGTRSKALGGADRPRRGSSLQVLGILLHATASSEYTYMCRARAHVMSYVMSCHVMSCHVMSCHVMSCHVNVCRVMSCYVMLCHVMSCYVMHCYPRPALSYGMMHFATSDGVALHCSASPSFGSEI